MIVNARVGYVRRLVLRNRGGRTLKAFPVVGGRELDQATAELKPLRPVGPAASRVLAINRKDRGPVRRDMRPLRRIIEARIPALRKEDEGKH